MMTLDAWMANLQNMARTERQLSMDSDDPYGRLYHLARAELCLELAISMGERK